MDAPKQFGHLDVAWAPAAEHDPRQVIAAWLQHRVVLALRQRASSMSVREMAALVGVNKSTMGRWLAGQEPLSLSALGALSAAFGLEILDGLAFGSRDVLDLLPPPYRPLARLVDGHLTFADPTEPAWVQLADTVGAQITEAEADGCGHLVTAGALASALARAAHRLPPTAGLVDIDAGDGSVVTFGLEQPISVAVTVVADGPASLARTSILRALGTPRVVGADARVVAALALGPRGTRILDQVLTGVAGRSATVSATVSATALARAGLGDPADPDVSVVELANVTGGAGCMVVLEIAKARGD